MRVRGGRAEERGGGGAAHRQIKEQVAPRGKIRNRIYLLPSPGDSLHFNFPAAAAGPKLPKISLIKVPTCATLQRARATENRKLFPHRLSFY